MFKINNYYTRKTIGNILNTNTNGGNWATGYTTFNNELYIFATIGCPARTGTNYNNLFLDDNTIEWYGKNNSNINQPLIKKIIENNIEAYLFVRINDKPNFKYLGIAKCIRAYNENPVRFILDYSGRDVLDKDFILINRIAEEVLSIEKDIETSIINIPSSEKNMIIKQRIGHSKLKSLLLKKQHKCQICDININELLIASHIKPWKVSKHKERLDINNVLLLCPNHDYLFDRGFISFLDNGSIIISKNIDITNYLSLNIKPSINIFISNEQKKYLKFHRDNIFRKAMINI